MAGAVNYNSGDETHIFLKKKAGIPVVDDVYGGKRLRTKEKQLQYQKNLFNQIFCKFCNGDKPKKVYEYFGKK